MVSRRKRCVSGVYTVAERLARDFLIFARKVAKKRTFDRLSAD